MVWDHGTAGSNPASRTLEGQADRRRRHLSRKQASFTALWVRPPLLPPFSGVTARTLPSLGPWSRAHLVSGLSGATEGLADSWRRHSAANRARRKPLWDRPPSLPPSSPSNQPPVCSGINGTCARVTCDRGVLGSHDTLPTCRIGFDSRRSHHERRWVTRPRCETRKSRRSPCSASVSGPARLPSKQRGWVRIPRAAPFFPPGPGRELTHGCRVCKLPPTTYIFSWWRSGSALPCEGKGRRFESCSGDCERIQSGRGPGL